MSSTSDYMEQLADRYPDATKEELEKIMEKESEKADAYYDALMEDQLLEI